MDADSLVMRFFIPAGRLRASRPHPVSGFAIWAGGYLRVSAEQRRSMDGPDRRTWSEEANRERATAAAAPDR
ncbi:hypothetical protein GCM10027615_52670 [Plantactinospora veratri]